MGILFQNEFELVMGGIVEGTSSQLKINHLLNYLCISVKKHITNSMGLSLN